MLIEISNHSRTILFIELVTFFMLVCLRVPSAVIIPEILIMQEEI